MKPMINFAGLLTGLQCLAEREKVMLLALINAHNALENGDRAKIERVVAEIIIAAAREKRKIVGRKIEALDGTR